MGMRFRKSIKIAPGVRVNLGKKSAGVSVGGKYGGVSVNSRTGTRARVSAPGTGMSYSEKIGRSSRSKAKAASTLTDDDLEAMDEIQTPDELRAQAEKWRQNYKAVTILYPIIAVIFAISAVAVPWALLGTVGMMVLFFKLRKKYRTEIPQLLQEAEDLEQ